MIGITKIEQTDDRHFQVAWTDDQTSVYDVVDLRKRCPCAVCLDEWTRKPLLDPESVKESVRPIQIDSVGQYAMKIVFDDHHQSGIYTFEFLRALDANLPTN